MYVPAILINPYIHFHHMSNEVVRDNRRCIKTGNLVPDAAVLWFKFKHQDIVGSYCAHVRKIIAEDWLFNSLGVVAISSDKFKAAGIFV